MFSLVLASMLVLAGCQGSTARPAPPPTLDIPRLDRSDRAGEAAGAGVRFGRVPPAVGDRWRVEVEAKSAAAEGGQLYDYTSTFDVEVLAIDGPAPSRVRLSFVDNTYHSRHVDIDLPTAVHGKTYVIDTTSPHVRDASGAPASAEEEEKVLDVFPELGTRTQIDQVLPDKPMAVGDERPELAAAITRIIHPRNYALNEGTATLASIEGDDAIFSVRVDATGRNGLRIDVKGSARVRLRDARLTSFDLAGPYTARDGALGGTITIRRIVRDR